MKEFFEIKPAEQRDFQITAIRDLTAFSTTNLRGDKVQGVGKLLEFEAITTAGRLTNQNTIFKSIFAEKTEDVDAEGNPVFRGAHRSLYSKLHQLGDKAIGMIMGATIINAVLSQPYYVMILGKDGKWFKAINKVTKQPIVAANITLIRLEGERGTPESDVRAAIRSRIRQGAFLETVTQGDDGKFYTADGKDAGISDDNSGGSGDKITDLEPDTDEAP